MCLADSIESLSIIFQIPPGLNLVFLHTRQGFPRFSPVLDISVLPFLSFISYHLSLTLALTAQLHMSPVKRICVFEHSVMTNFNCACPAIQRGKGSGFLSEGSSWLTAYMSEQWRFWRDCADAQARLNIRFSHRRQVPNSLDAVHIILVRGCCNMKR